MAGSIQQQVHGGRKTGGVPVQVIDDERELCQLIKDYLEPLGYEVSAAHSGPAGLERAVSGDFKAVILDVMLPGMDGFEVLKRIRATSDVPVLMLTARGEEADRIVGLEFGADDYLPKTFSPRELLARLRAVMRRTTRAAATQKDDGPVEMVVGALRIHHDTRMAALGDKPLGLTALEFDLLVTLAKAPGRVRTREQLLEAFSERDYEAFDRSVDVHVHALRKKLGDDPKTPRFIRTVHGVGYVFVNPDAEE